MVIKLMLMSWILRHWIFTGIRFYWYFFLLLPKLLLLLSSSSNSLFFLLNTTSFFIFYCSFVVVIVIFWASSSNCCISFGRQIFECQIVILILCWSFIVSVLSSFPDVPASTLASASAFAPFFDCLNLFFNQVVYC